ncbi:MAG TPA: hypothetical protein VH414_17680 [Lichenihabitans sp.]|nr:hypothetical protein [Lichenihabitans sp.]
MKAACLGLCLSLLGGVAMAQSAPSGSTPPPPPANAPHAVMPSTGGPTFDQSQADQNHAPAGSPGAQPGGGYEGEIIQTPDGTYLVGPHPNQMGGSGEDMEDMPGGPEGPGGPGHMMPHPPHPPHMKPPAGKAAAFRIKGPNLELGVKCAEDESMKACVDALMPLLDRIGPAHP